MARSKPKPYRQASGSPASPPSAPRSARWTIAAAFPAAVFATILLVAGPFALAALTTLLYAAFPLTLLVAAAILGLAFTAPLARRGIFANSPWPDAWRLLISTALGLGALGLATLLLGSLGLVGERWFAPALLIAAVAIGFVAARAFFATFDWTPLKTPARNIDWLILLAAPPVAMLLLAATYPPGTLWASEGRGYDVLEYHLQLPREYASLGSTAPLAHNVYSFFPSLIEMLYLLLMQLAKLGMHSQDHVQAVFPAQLFHAGLMLLAAAALALAPLRLGPLGRILALTLFLATPWTIVCGSLAYNEAGVMLFGAIALGLALGGGDGPFVGGRSPATALTQVRSASVRGLAVGGRSAATALTIGILLGLAVGCKLTAGVFVALPVGLILLATAHWRSLVFATAVALLVFAPWALRAAIASGGNPIFPLAANQLGHNGWTTEQVDRWNRGHAAQPAQASLPGRLTALGHELFLHPQWSPGLAAIDRWTADNPSRVNPQPEPWWRDLGLLWLILPLALAAALLPAAHRAPAAVATAWLLTFILALQILAWLFLTHLESRFLLPCLIPLCWLIGLGVESARPGSNPWLRVLITAFIGLQALTCIFLLIPETGLFHDSLTRDSITGEPLPQPIGVLFDDDETPGKTVYFLGDAKAFYYRGHILYNTVFDTNPLAAELRARGPAGAAAWLAAHHVEQLRINWNEIARFRKTYGYDPAITPEALAALTQSAHLTPAPPPPGTRGLEIWDLPNPPPATTP